MSNHRYDIEDLPIDLVSLKLRYISKSKYEGDWHSTPHTHSCTEVFYVVSGLGRFHIEDMDFPVKANDVVIVNHSVEHTETALAQTPMEYIVAGVDGVDFLLHDGPDDRYCLLHCGTSRGSTLNYLQQMLDELESQQPYCNRTAHNLLEIFIINLLRSRALSMEKQEQKAASRECKLVRRYIDAHFKESISLDDLAQVAHLNKYYLVHSFTREYGISPIHYLTKQRITESRHLLAHTNQRISDISQQLGFSSPSYFSQCFSRMEGITPKEYRTRRQNEYQQSAVQSTK